MTNPTRTRAEIQADEAAEIDQQIQALTEKRKALSACWISGYRLPDTEYGCRRVEILMSGGDVVRPLLGDSVALIPADNLIPRAEYERAVEEAREVCIDRATEILAKFSAVADIPSNTTYAWAGGDKYRVTVERVEDHIRDVTKKVELADAEPVGWANRMSDGAWSGVYASKGTARSVAEYGGWAEIAVPLYRHPAPIAPPQGTAVAPMGVVDELKSALRSVQADRVLAELEFQAGLARAFRALARITELPEPTTLEIGIAEVTKIDIEHGGPDAEKPTPEGVAAALLAKEGE